MMNSIDLIISARQHLAEAMSLIDIAGTMKPKTGHWFIEQREYCLRITKM